MTTGSSIQNSPSASTRSVTTDAVTQYEALKVFGERNTGTNYLIELIELNAPIAVLRGTVPASVGRAQRLLPGREWLRDRYFAKTTSANLGWKHRLVDPAVLLEECPRINRIAFVTLTKNPYSWLLSLQRRPYHRRGRKLSMAKFLRTPWHTVGRESAPASFENPVELWNRKNAAYLALADAFPAVNARYEDLLADPEKVIKAIVMRLFPEDAGREFRNVVQAVKKKDGQKDFYYYRSYYLEERWRDNLAREDIEYISSKLDARVMERFGYARLAG